MNYRIVKNPKSDLIHYNFSKNNTHNKASNLILTFSKHFVRICTSILKAICTPSKYVYDEVSDTCRPSNDNYYFKDTTELKIRSYQRTFL